MRMAARWLRTLGLPGLLACATASSAACPRPDADAVAGTLRAMYAAAQTDDMAAFRDVFAPSFYAFDGGRRFDGMALPDLIKSAHAAGKVYVWTVTKPDVHFSCDTAWIAYVNEGSVGDAAHADPMTWLESANLAYTQGKWRITFFHSTRVPPKP
jgi:hypothetical protein